MKNIRSKTPVPFYLLLISILAYGIYIPWFGFYGDDWSYIWYQHLLGFGGAGVFAAYDRPFSAGYYNVVQFLLGESVWPYEVYSLLLRWAGAVLLWMVLGRIWKKNLRSIFWVATLFLIYPGFGQQPISVEFILHFAVLDLFLLSLLGMLNAIGTDKKGYLWLTGISMLCTASVFGLEYFVGLEILRPFLIWKALENEPAPIMEKGKKILLHWLPYLVILGVFLFWRIFVFKFPTYQPGMLGDMVKAPLSTSIALFKRIGMDFKILLLDAWRSILHLPGGQWLLTYVSLLLGGAGISVFFFNMVFNQHKADPEIPATKAWEEWPVQAGMLGFVTLLTAGAPFWATGIPLTIAFPWDRTMLPFMLGVCLVMVALLELIVHPRVQLFVFAGLVGLTLGWHLSNALVYHQEWEHMQSFYWQLAWRAPGLQPGTIIMSDQIPLYKVSDSGMTAPLNWTYAPDAHDRNLPYNVFDLDVRLDSGFIGLTQIQKGVQVTHNYRSLLFNSTTDKSLVFMDKLNTCLHILTPKDSAVTGLPPKVERTLPLSNLEDILPEPERPAKPPAVVFGDEPAHGWCYFYQKADLARQQNDWPKVAVLWKQASGQSLQPLDPFELLPFIEGLAYTGDINQADNLSNQVYQDANLRNRLCAAWNEIRIAPGVSDRKNAISTIMTKNKCSTD